MAALTKQQYSDWLNRFAPTEDRLMELATSNELFDAQKERNETNAALNLRQAETSAANSGAKYGLGDRRTDQQKNNLELTNALSLASMNNEGRQAIGDLQRQIISGASSGAKQKINEVGGR
ncbi:hypothetical protein HW45_02675 [Vibrio sp. ER1A]|nr:hypothetical protein HW45_02675 [Vibrio sp. ER1A]